MASVTRREALKRGAAIGATAIWVSPVVQSIGMSPAFAQAVSDGDATYYALKIDPTAPGGCEDIWDQTGIPSGGHCLDVDESVTPVAGGCDQIDQLVDVAEDNDPTPWKIVLAGDCYPLAIARKGPNECATISVDDAWDESTHTVTVEHGQTAISHVEMVICCPN